MLKQFLLASFACALAVVSGFGVSTKAEAKPVYTVAMDAAYPPFGSQDLKSKEYVGYDVDIIKAIAAKEGFAVKIRNLQFDGLIPALRTGTLISRSTTSRLLRIARRTWISLIVITLPVSVLWFRKITARSVRPRILKGSVSVFQSAQPVKRLPVRSKTLTFTSITS